MPSKANPLLSKHSSSEFLRNASFTAIAWVGMFEANAYIFESFVLNEHVSWIFLPAAIRILSVLLVGSAGVVGLFVGSMLINLPADNLQLVDAISYSLITALSPLVGVWLMSRWVPLNTNLQGLKWWHIIVLATVGASLSVGGTQVYWASCDLERFNPSWWPMLVGDTIGTLMVLYAVSFAAKLVMKIR